MRRFFLMESCGRDRSCAATRDFCPTNVVVPGFAIIAPAVMQATNGRLVLSPSDLNDYVECAHLATLSLEVARGSRRRPHMPEDHADLLRRKGEEHEVAYLADLRAQGRQVVDAVGADRWDFETSARAT